MIDWKSERAKAALETACAEAPGHYTTLAAMRGSVALTDMAKSMRLATEHMLRLTEPQP